MVSISPAPGDVVGIGRPETVECATSVQDRSSAQRAIVIDVSVEVPRRFMWVSERAVRWRPDGAWPAHTPVSVTAGGMSTRFDVDAAVVSVADISAHTFTVSIDGQAVRAMPASLGKPRFEKPLGTLPVVDRERRVTFDARTIGIPLDDPEGYLIEGEFGVRIAWGGVYVHSAPWSKVSQGNENVSHGRINLSPENAEWYLNTVDIGDPVIVRN